MHSIPYNSPAPFNIDDIPYNPPYSKISSESLVGADSVYSGSISSTVLNWFSGYYRTHYTGNESYLILRDKQYSYKMYVGSIAQSGKTCVLTDCDMITYNNSSSSYDFTPYYTVDLGVSAVIDITSGNELSTYVYSDVVGAGLPDIEAYNNQLSIGIWTGISAVMICIACLFCVIRGWLTRHDRKD